LKQLCKATDKITAELFLPHEAEYTLLTQALVVWKLAQVKYRPPAHGMFVAGVRYVTQITTSKRWQCSDLDS